MCTATFFWGPWAGSAGPSRLGGGSLGEKLLGISLNCVSVPVGHPALQTGKLRLQQWKDMLGAGWPCGPRSHSGPPGAFPPRLGAAPAFPLPVTEAGGCSGPQGGQRPGKACSELRPPARCGHSPSLLPERPTDTHTRCTPLRLRPGPGVEKLYPEPSDSGCG